MKISASIYSDKDREIIDTISDLVAHQVDLLHVDCNDDLSVFEDIKDIRKWCDLPIDLHIITETPEKYYELLRRNPVEYVTFQFEELPKNTIIPNDIPGEKGLGIVTPTAVDVFEEYKAFDFILMMATVPGQSGGKFDPLNFSKIREFKRKFPDKNVHVDGGVNGEVSFILRNMGVRASVSGSFLFKATSVGQALMDLTKREIESSFKVRDFMVPRLECPILELEELSLEKVLQQIEIGSLGLCIVEHNEDFKGIISNADVRRGLIKNIQDIYAMDMRAVVNDDPVTISADSTVNEMLQLVRSKPFPINYIPVLDEKNKAVGVVTFFNLIKGEL
jgi:pentose-5-phosphate-3-epimerase/predicted transcriptional regulator